MASLAVQLPDGAAQAMESLFRQRYVMADPLLCLRNTTIGIAIWNIIYSLIQMGIMGWQVKEVRDRQWEYENRQLPATGAIDGFQARFPGLYAIYTETPDRRRINAMFAVVLCCVFLAFVHFFVSIVLLYGAIKYYKNCIWPWFFSAGPIIIMSTAYAVMWWSGDVFNEQLTMSVAEFVMSLAVNGICLILVIFFYFRLTGQLTSDKPAKHHHHHRHHRDRVTQREIYYSPQPLPKGPVILQVDTVTPKPHSSRRNLEQSTSRAPAWREEWPSVPDVQLQRKMKRRRSRSPIGRPLQRKPDSGLDFYAPETYDKDFPWKTKKLREPEPKRETPRETIERLYYENNPEELPNLPRGMRSSIRKERNRGKSPERVTWSRNDPAVHYRTPTDSSVQRNSVV